MKRNSYYCKPKYSITILSSFKEKVNNKGNCCLFFNMEFFEKAHVMNNNSLKKGEKIQKNIKKQLKQMLQGYKQNDNELIKCALKQDNDMNDSLSNNSFTDLDISKSINCTEWSKASLSSESIPSKIESEDLDLSEVIESDQSLNSKKSEDKLSESIANLEVTNDYIDDKYVLDSEDINFDSEDSILVDSPSITTSSDNSQTFDVDGRLAAKILERLENKEDTLKVKKNQKKKIIKIKDGNEEKVSKKTKRNKTSLKSSKMNEYIDIHRAEIGSLETDSDCEEDYIDIYSCSRPKRIVSCPYVSIEAKELPDEGLGDILGDYKHSTVGFPIASVTNTPHLYNIFSSSIDEFNVTIEEPSDDTSYMSTGVIADSTFSNNELNSNFETENSHLAEVDNFNEMKTNESVDNQITEINYSTETESSLAKPIEIYYLDKSCIFVLKHPIELYIHGKVHISSLAGTQQILGYKLHGNSCTVYAPNYSHAHCLKTVENDNDFYGLFAKLTSVGLSVADTESIVISLQPNDSVILAKPVNSRKMDFVDQNMSNIDLFNKNDKNIRGIFMKASNILGCSLYLERPYKCFQDNAIWEQIVNLSSGMF